MAVRHVQEELTQAEGVRAAPAPGGAPAVARSFAAAIGNQAFTRMVGSNAAHSLPSGTIDARLTSVLAPRAGDAERAPGRAAEIHSVSAGTVLARFGSAEHRDIGDEASGGGTVEIDLGGGEKLTYGQMVALAGDYFGSLSEMQTLAGTPAGQEQLRAARYLALGIGSAPGADALKAVQDRYYGLAARNISHFSAGGTARNEYQRYHNDALSLAFYAGVSGDDGKFAEARTTEAFGNHYLTDMFSAGHVRTPRQAIKEWYAQQFPDSLDRFLSHLAWGITRILDRNGDIPFYWPNSSVADTMKAQIRELGGPAAEAFTLGDIVSLAFHNQDNKGLGVVSDVDQNGTEIPGGFHWTAKGDDRLADSPITRQMVVGATRTSLADLDEARQRGVSAGAGACLPEEQWRPLLDQALEEMRPFKAEGYIPREDPIAGNTQMNWRWGELDPVLSAAVDAEVRGTIAGTLRGKAGSVPATIRKNRRGHDDPDGAITLHVRAAFTEFVDAMAGQGIAAIEEAMGSPAAVAVDSLDAGVPLPAGVPDDSADAGTGGGSSADAGTATEAGVSGGTP